MTKKLILASLMAFFFINSCSDDNNEINMSESSHTKSETSSKASSSNTITTFPVFLSVGNSPAIEDIITVNPNYEYYSDYNVYAGDDNYSLSTPNCLGDGKPCINLSHFLGRYGAYSKYPSFNPASTARFPLFYGDNGYDQFYSYPRPQGVFYDTVVSFNVNENGYSSPLFNHGGYMTNDGANSILHHFKDMIATISNNNQGVAPKIFAAHFQYKAWFTDPASRQAKMSIRYYY